MTLSKEEIVSLAKSVQGGSEDAFRDLVVVARPLLVSLSKKFSDFNSKFDFDDFYSIALLSLYKASMSFKDGNPSFLNYAKIFIIRAFWREIDYWNQDKRNIFLHHEVDIENEHIPYNTDDLVEIAFVNEFRTNLNQIIDECFDAEKSNILRLYLLKDTRVCEIALDKNLNYKYVHKIIERGTKKIKREYINRFQPQEEIVNA
jgi:RNA polymerase sigma factor (sigma-70 family)